MSGFPYPDTESYPSDDAHLQYLKEYNTRIITASNQSLALEDYLATWVIAIITVLVAVDLFVLLYFKKRSL